MTLSTRILEIAVGIVPGQRTSVSLSSISQLTWGNRDIYIKFQSIVNYCLNGWGILNHRYIPTVARWTESMDSHSNQSQVYRLSGILALHTYCSTSQKLGLLAPLHSKTAKNMEINSLTITTLMTMTTTMTMITSLYLSNLPPKLMFATSKSFIKNEKYARW